MTDRFTTKRVVERVTAHCDDGDVSHVLLEGSECLDCDACGQFKGPLHSWVVVVLEGLAQAFCSVRCAIIGLEPYRRRKP